MDGDLAQPGTMFITPCKIPLGVMKLRVSGMRVLS